MFSLFFCAWQLACLLHARDSFLELDFVLSPPPCFFPPLFLFLCLSGSWKIKKETAAFSGASTLFLFRATFGSIARQNGAHVPAASTGDSPRSRSLRALFLTLYFLPFATRNLAGLSYAPVGSVGTRALCATVLPARPRHVRDLPVAFSSASTVKRVFCRRHFLHPSRRVRPRPSGSRR